MKKILTVAISITAASAMLLCGCGKSPSRPSKSEVKAQIIRKYSRHIPEEQILALMGENADSGAASSGIINLANAGLTDAFTADMEAYRAAGE